MSANAILVFSEKDSLRRELLGKARQEADGLGWQVAAVVFDSDPTATSLGNAGADLVYPVPAAAGEDLELLLHVLSEVARQVQPAFILIGATKIGMEVAAALTEHLDASYAPWAVSFEIDPSTCALTAGCMLYAGSGMATYQFNPGLVLLTSAPGVYTQADGAGKAAHVVALPFGQARSRVEILGRREKTSGAASLESAHCVIDVGQGFKQREDLALAETVGGLLDAQLACSRPISSDRDWFPEWLGLSGKKIKPDLCLCVGVSGAIQHVVGIRDAHRIAAVNNDEGAPIYTQADYGVVTDLYQFLPAFAERIRARNLRPAWTV